MFPGLATTLLVSSYYLGPLPIPFLPDDLFLHPAAPANQAPDILPTYR